MTHLNTDALARYVAGLSEGDEVRDLEAHVLECPRCAQALAREARIELALSTVSRRAHAQRWWVVPAVLVPLAAAAALVLLLARPHATPGPDEAPAFFEVTRFEGSTPHPVLSAPASL